MISIRSIAETDAPAFLELCRQLDHESQFMLLEPGERQTSVADQQAQIAGLLASPNRTLLVAESAGQLVGYLSADGGEFRRNRHVAYIVVGIREAYTGQGIGTRLFAALEDWAQSHGIRRLELTVMAHNLRALQLYLKRGFVVEGYRRHALCVDGRYVDEYAMARLFGETPLARL